MLVFNKIKDLDDDNFDQFYVFQELVVENNRWRSHGSTTPNIVMSLCSRKCFSSFETRPQVAPSHSSFIFKNASLKASLVMMDWGQLPPLTLKVQIGYLCSEKENVR